jgi:hypothetical protein
MYELISNTVQYLFSIIDPILRILRMLINNKQSQMPHCFLVFNLLTMIWFEDVVGFNYHSVQIPTVSVRNFCFLRFPFAIYCSYLIPFFLNYHVSHTVIFISQVNLPLVKHLNSINSTKKKKKKKKGNLQVRVLQLFVFHFTTSKIIKGNYFCSE